MMKAFESTNLPFLREDCEKEFAQPMGTRIFGRAQDLYHELAAQADDKGNPAIAEHLRGKLLPAMAYYKALLAEGIPKNNALAAVRRETQKAALIKKESSARMVRIPFAFLVYRMGVKSHMRMNFPMEGWETEWVSNSAREIHFNLHRCLYWDLCRQQGCPELCTVYCENDITAFSGLLPKIRFERSGTLGEGAACCDFHFINGKYASRD